MVILIQPGIKEQRLRSGFMTLPIKIHFPSGDGSGDGDGSGSGYGSGSG